MNQESKSSFHSLLSPEFATSIKQDLRPLVHLINVGRDRIFTGPQIHDLSCINFDVKVAIDTCTKNFQGTVMEE